MAVIGAALLSLISSLISLAVPEVNKVVKQWLERWGDDVARELPDVHKQIEKMAISFDDSAGATDLANRLRESAKG